MTIQPQFTSVDQWGGVNQGGPCQKIPLGMWAETLNYEIDELGDLSPRQGHGLMADLPAPDLRPIRTIYPADFDGVVRLLVATDQHVYEFVPTNTPETQWVLLSTIASPGKRMTFAMLNSNTNPLLVWGNGAIHMQKWNGTDAPEDVGEITGTSPHGRPMSYQGWLTVFDIPDKPGYVLFAAKSGSADHWMPDGGVAYYLDVEGKVTGLAEYGGLVIFTATKTSLFSGIPSDVAGLAKLSNTVGCICHETIQDCAGNLVWLAQSGVMAWGGSGKFPLGCMSNPPDELQSRIQRELNRSVYTEIENSASAYHPVKQLYFISMRTNVVNAGIGVPWRTFVFNIRKSAWMPWSLEATSMAIITSAEERVPFLVSGTSTGMLRYEDAGDFIDRFGGGSYDVEYPYFVKTGDFDLGMQDTQKVFRAIKVTSSGQTGSLTAGTRTLNGVVSGEYDRTNSGIKSVAINAGGFTLGVHVLGKDALGAGYRMTESRTPFALRAKKFNILIEGQGVENAVTVSALEIEWYPIGVRKILVGAEEAT